VETKDIMESAKARVDEEMTATFNIPPSRICPPGLEAEVRERIASKMARNGVRGTPENVAMWRLVIILRLELGGAGRGAGGDVDYIQEHYIDPYTCLVPAHDHRE